MPETCARCGAPADAFVEEDEGCSWMCTHCAADAAGIESFESFLAGFAHPRRIGGPCPHCGTTRDQVATTGLVGCPLCYEVFPELIEELSE